MLKNYLTSAWRNLRKNKLLSIINLGGLSVGIAAVLLIGMYIFWETGYDRFQLNKSSVYRVGFKFWQSGKLLGTGPEFTAPFAVDVQNELPGIKAFTRVSSPRTAFVSYGEKSIKLENIRYADSAFFRIFSYKLLYGSEQSVLNQPHTIVLTSESAYKLFGAVNAVGKVVRMDNNINYTVTGIVEPAPVNSELSYNALASFSTLYAEPGNYMDWNGGEQYSAYLQLNKGVISGQLEKNFPAFMWKHINKQYAAHSLRVDASLQPLQDIHLYYSENATTLRTNIYIFSVVALLILAISSVNYINLTTAQATTRFKEIGVRKVLGAVRSQIVGQFLTEAILLTTIAFIIAVALVMLGTPVYQQLTGKPLPPLNISTLPVLLLLFIIIIVVGAAAGSYVAFYLSSFNVTRIFKALLPKSTQSIFKKGLIVGQFAVTIGLVACTVMVTLQLRYSKKINTGFDRKQVVVLPLTGEQTQKYYSVLQQKLVSLAAIQQVSAVSEVPYNGITNNGFVPEGETKALIIHQLDADENLLKTLNIKMVSGSYFSKDRSSLDDGYVINETLAKTLGWQNPLGKILNRNGSHKVVGVISDFHFASLHDKIEPLIITNKPYEDRYGYLTIRYKSGDNIPALIASIKQTWNDTFAGVPFEYWFLDDAFNTIYQSEERFQQIFMYFSVLSVILSLAGVFGLVALTIKQRIKEFGIRKILGAGVWNIIVITVKDFAILVIIAAVIITPLSWYYMHLWLQNFAYHIQLSVWLFALCGMIVLVITVCTISFQAIKAALLNPVKSLKSE